MINYVKKDKKYDIKQLIETGISDYVLRHITLL